MKSTLILSRNDGTVIKSTGLATSDVQKETFGEAESSEERFQLRADDLARMVVEFLRAVNVFAHGMDNGDEGRLLRLRTKRHEVVIVPGETCFSTFL